VDILLDLLSHYGMPGVLLAIVIVLYVQKDRELKKEREARIDDAKAFHTVVLGVQEKALNTANRLTEVFDELRRQYPRRSS